MRGRAGAQHRIAVAALVLAGMLLPLFPRSAFALEQIEAAQVSYLPVATYKEAGREFRRMRRLGINTVILRVFQHPGDRVYPFVDPKAPAGVYFATDEAPVVADILPDLIPLAHAAGLKVFAWMTTLSTPLGGPPGLMGRRYDLATGKLVPTDRLDPFNPEVRRRLLALFRDLGRYKLDGILLQNDLDQHHTEGFSAAAMAAYRLQRGRNPDPEDFFRDRETALGGAVRIRRYSESFREWAEWKSIYLAHLAADLQTAARRENPHLLVVPNLSYEVISRPGAARAWFSEDLHLYAGVFDYVAVTLYHRQIANELGLSPRKAALRVATLAKSGAELLSDPSALLAEIQTVDFGSLKALKPTEWRRIARDIRRAGPVSVAFFPYCTANDMQPSAPRPPAQEEDP
jgi:biofilm PGA synthesis lipoprotein PgaB